MPWVGRGVGRGVHGVGCRTLGLDPADPDYDDYHFVQTVELSSDWAIGQTEVTHEVGVSDAVRPAWHGGRTRPLGDCDTCPANNVSWHEAHAFANALSAAEGLEQCFSCEGRDRQSTAHRWSIPTAAPATACPPRRSGSTPPAAGKT